MSTVATSYKSNHDDLSPDEATGARLSYPKESAAATLIDTDLQEPNSESTTNKSSSSNLSQYTIDDPVKGVNELSPCLQVPSVGTTSSTPPPHDPQEQGKQPVITINKNNKPYQGLERFNTVNDPRTTKDISWIKSGAPSNTPVLSPERNLKGKQSATLLKFPQIDPTKSESTLPIQLKGEESFANVKENMIPLIPLESKGGSIAAEPNSSVLKREASVAGLSVVPPPPPSRTIFSSSPNKKTQLSLNDLLDAVNVHVSIDGTLSSPSPLAKQYDPFYPSPFGNYTTDTHSSRAQTSILQSNYNESYYLNNYDILDNAFKNKLDQNLNSTFNKPDLNSTAPSSSTTIKLNNTKLQIPSGPAHSEQGFERSLSSSPVPSFETSFPEPKPFSELFQASSVSLSDTEEPGDFVHRRSKSLSDQLIPRPFRLKSKASNPANNLPSLTEVIPKDEFPSYRFTINDPIIPKKRRLSFLSLTETLNGDEQMGSNDVNTEQEEENEGVSLDGTDDDSWDLEDSQKDFDDIEDDKDNEAITGLKDKKQSRRKYEKSKEEDNTTEEELTDGEQQDYVGYTFDEESEQLEMFSEKSKETKLNGKFKPENFQPFKKGRNGVPDFHYGPENATDEPNVSDFEDKRKKNFKKEFTKGTKSPSTSTKSDKPKSNKKASTSSTVKSSSANIPKKKKTTPGNNGNSSSLKVPKPSNKPTLETIDGKLVKVRIDKNKKKVLVLPRSKNGCWTCRIRKKKCSEEKPHCYQCLKLDLECDGYGLEKPEFMMNQELQKDKLNLIKIHTSQRKKLGLIKFEDLVKQGKIIPANNVTHNETTAEFVENSS